MWRDLKFFLVDRWKGMAVYELAPLQPRSREPAPSVRAARAALTVVAIQRLRRPPHPVTFTEGALSAL